MDGIQYLMNSYMNRINEVSTMISRGLCHDYADYRQKCGHIRGLEEAIEMLRDVERKLQEDDEDE